MRNSHSRYVQLCTTRVFYSTTLIKMKMTHLSFVAMWNRFVDIAVEHISIDCDCMTKTITICKLYFRRRRRKKLLIYTILMSVTFFHHCLLYISMIWNSNSNSNHRNPNFGDTMNIHWTFIDFYVSICKQTKMLNKRKSISTEMALKFIEFS